MKKIEVIQGASLKKGESTLGIARDKAFESANVLFGRSRIAGGVKSGWHHHARKDLYGFLLSGKLRFDFGEGGTESVGVEVGDFFHIPAGVVHRDVNPDPQDEAMVISVLVGKGLSVVNVSGPSE